MKNDIKGVFAPITTPFVNEELSIEQFRENVRKYSETPLAGFYVLGSNGEAKSLTEDEKLKVLEAVMAEKAPHQLVMAGAGYESTRQSIAFSKVAQSMGVDFVTLLTPSYFKKRMTDEAIAKYFEDVANAVSVPVIAYNAPGFTGLTISPGVIARISRHKNIIGMKDSSPGNMGKYLAAKAEGFAVLAGSASILLTGMVLGASGGVVSLGNAFPHKCCDLYDLYQKGDMEGALKTHYLLFRLNQAVSGSFGVAGVKYAMDVAGYHGGDPRLPLLPITEDGKRSIDAAIKAAGLK
ncbi:MAG: dihydrodipicolinate synthase family protein [Deltaproteobacteria bacterium]|nr:dihydrodipicolinate synthase family protein [Deltaproteobacteria bacterium]